MTTTATAEAPAAPTAINPAELDVFEFQRNTVCVQVRFSMWGVDRKLTTSEYETEASKDRTAATKKIITGPEYRAIEKLTWSTRDQIELWALKCSMLKQGNYSIPIGMIDTVDGFLKRRHAEWDAAVEAFVAKYPELVALARLPKDQGGLGPLFDIKQYPPAEVVKASFAMRSRWYTMAVPDALADLSAELFRREVEKNRAGIAESINEARAGLRVAFAELVRRMTDRLTENDDGKPRVFKDTLVTRMEEFLDTISKRDVTNDVELQRLADEARAIMNVVPDAKTLRSDGELRELVRNRFARIEATVDTMVEEQGRAFSFDNE